MEPIARKFSDGWFLVLVLLLALGVRLDFLIHSQFVIDADEAIVGLMGLHLIEHGALSTFYYGQHYMGSLEPLLAGIAFFLFGVEAAVLKGVPLLFSLVFVLLCFFLGRRLAGLQAGRLAALLAALPPATLVVWSSKARGGFIEVVVLGTLALFLTTRWLQGVNRTLLAVFTIGVVLGFGWWVNNQVLYYMVPVFFAFLASSWREPRRIAPRAAVGTCGFFVGGLPFWVYNFVYDFASFSQLARERESDLVEHLSGLVGTALPILLGSKRYWQSEDLYPGSTVIVYGIYLALIAAAFLSVRRSRQTFLSRPTLLLLLGFAVTVPTVFVLSSFGYLAQAPRYMLPFYSALFPLTGAALALLFQQRRILGALFTALILGTNVFSSYYSGRAIPGEPFVYEGERVSRDHTQLNRWLQENDVRWIRTNYWIGYRLAFETAEATRFVVFQEPLERRIKQYEKEGKAYGTERMPFVLTPKQSELVKRGLALSGYLFKEVELSGYSVLYEITPEQLALSPVSKDLFTVYVSDKPERVPFALDQDSDTRWGSGRPQSGEMFFSFKFEEPQLLAGIEYDLGKWIHDYPRSLQIEAVLSDGSRKRIVGKRGYQALQYLLVGPTIRIYFEPLEVKQLILTQKGSDPYFDWSIADIQLLKTTSSS